MKIQYFVYKLFGLSLLQLAKIIMCFYPVIFVLFILFALTGCSNVSIHHEDGKKPKLKIETEYVDDVKLRISSKRIIVYLRWEL